MVSPFDCFPEGSPYSFQPNTALVKLKASVGALLWTVRDECQPNCLPMMVCAFSQEKMQILFNTTSRTAWKLDSGGPNGSSNGFLDAGHGGLYSIDPEQSDPVSTMESPESNWLSIAVIFLFCCLVLLFDAFHMFHTSPFWQEQHTYSYSLRGWLNLMYREIRGEYVAEHHITWRRIDQEHPPCNTRIWSIDMIRGLTITLMIFVNYGGGGLQFFTHSSWDGITLADWIFPNFLFIMGLSIGVSEHRKMCSPLRPPENYSPKYVRAIERCIVLFLIGLIAINASPSFQSLRIMGVLQRISLCYFFFYCVRRRTYRQSFYERNSSNGGNVWIELKICMYLAVFVSLLSLIPVEGCPYNYRGPGGISDGGRYAHCTGGFLGFVDRLIIPFNNLFPSATCMDVFQCQRFEPEGILTTFLAAINIFLGFQAATFYMQREALDETSIYSCCLRLFIWGFVYMTLGLFMHFTALIPFNKNLWSISFVLATSGISYWLLALVQFYHANPNHKAFGTLFYAMGKNSIIFYIFSELTTNVVPFHFYIGSSRWCLTLSALIGTYLYLILGYIFYRKEVFIYI